MIEEVSKPKKSGGFQSMSLPPPVFNAIKRKGYNVPTPIQRKAIPLILAGHDVIACSKTGSGKTAAFIIPLAAKLQAHSTIVGIRGLIILPTRELALQTAQVLRAFIKYTDLLYSIMVGGHGFEGQFESLAQNPDILICTPGRLLQHLAEKRISLTRVQMVIYDEADFLFEMGLGEQLKSIMKYLPPQKQSLIFSATIPEQLSQFASAGLKDYIYVKLDKEYQFPDTMSLNFLLVASENKLSALIYLLQTLDDRCLVFASTRYLVDVISYALGKFQISNVHIYGKMDQQDRKEQLENFRNSEAKVLVVTDLASRGIDIPMVPNVIHFDYPAKPKIFIHRSGRTARAGKFGSVFALIAPEEILYIKETMLYAGRKLVCEGEVDDTSKAFYGQFPIDLLMENQEKVNRLNEDLEFQNLMEAAKKAHEQFRKTRGSARKVRSEIDTTKVHPMFAGKSGIDAETRDVIEQIKNFKSPQSVIEMRLQQSNMKKDPFLKAVSHLRAVSKAAPKQTEPRREVVKRAFDTSQFIDQEHYIPTTKDPNAKSEFDELRKIGNDDINHFIIGEDNEGLRKANRRVWDRKTKKFKFERQQTQDKEDKGMVQEKSVKSFQKWQKRNQVQLQEVGEEEDQMATQRAKEMFKKRQMRSKGFYFNEERPQARGRNEIKSSEQLLKRQSKKIKKNLQFKNMEKKRRRQVEKKIKSTRQK